MSGQLRVTGTNSGELVDVIHLNEQGRLVYRTGRARSLFESRRNATPGRNHTDEQLYELLAGTSNGYLSIHPTEGDTR